MKRKAMEGPDANINDELRRRNASYDQHIIERLILVRKLGGNHLAPEKRARMAYRLNQLDKKILPRLVENITALYQVA